MDTKFNPPSELSFDTDGNLSATWKKWKEHFNFYITATEAEGKTDKIKTSMLLTLIGEKGRELYESFDLVEDEKMKLDKMSKVINFLLSKIDGNFFDDHSYGLTRNHLYRINLKQNWFFGTP